MLPSWFSSMHNALCGMGLQLHTNVDLPEKETFVSNARSCLLFANGGRALWEAFSLHLANSDDIVENPLDTWLEQQVKNIASTHIPSPIRYHWLFSNIGATPQIDFRKLALTAGMGWHSHMNMIIHPSYGLWLGLRAILILDVDIVSSTEPPLPNASPCLSCPKYCAQACPVSAVSQTTPWQWQTCLTHKDTHCGKYCHSRLACPIGKEHAHSPLQRMYHDNPTRYKQNYRAFILQQ